MSALVSATEKATALQPRAKDRARVREVLREVPLIDGHNDLPWQCRNCARNLAALDLRAGTDKMNEPWVTDIPRLRAGGVGGHSLGNSLAVLRMLHQLGARYLTLTQSRNTTWADAAGDPPEHGGLTPFGEEVVRVLNRLGMMVNPTRWKGING